MNKQVCFLLLVVGLMCGCGVHKATLKENYFHDTCDQKLPLKVALIKPHIETVEEGSLSFGIKHINTRMLCAKCPGFRIVNIGEALAASLTSLLACHFERVTLVDSPDQAAEDGGLLAYSEYLMKITYRLPTTFTSEEADLKLTFKKTDGSVIASCNTKNPVEHYTAVGTQLAAGALTGCTLGLAGPATIPWVDHAQDKACEEAIADNISTSVAQLNKLLGESLANDPIWIQQKHKE